jgi:anti-sigma-K factor RskA
MYDDDDQDALAAEYVLGTLSRDEREQAAALLAIDPGFAAVVRSWERRLGELNVMVEAVEPPPQLWTKIRAAVTGVEPSPELQLPLIEEAPTAAPSAEPVPAKPSPAAPTPPALPTIERSADVVYLARRVRRWRRISAMMGAIAAVLALIVATPVIAPQLLPAQWQLSELFPAAKPPPATPPARQLVAVLQHDPGLPGFLLTIDPASRMLTVRRVAAQPESNRSYELWLVSKHFPSPRSLGVVGIDEFTQRPIPANYDQETVSSATYAVSLEPSGGSPRGVPTGPVLFTGRLIEAQPAPPPASAAPRT